ncbi:MAG TPA: hypothetical protein PKH33_16675, partial [bacterium]|nr:hypothetical protein [bacterium]
MIKQRKKRLETRFGTVAILAVFLLFYTSRAAFAIDTWFMPFDSLRYPPSISDITNTSPEAGSTMKVYATIEGMPQKRICQGENCDRYNCLWMQRYFFLDDLSTNCEWAGWYLTPDPDSIPNPPCIPNPNGTGSCHSNDNPKLYYRINDDFAGTQSVIMSYNSNIGKFEGTINLAEISSGDTLTYFISAVDSMGNVVSQIPQQGSTPCSSLTSWNADYATPSTNNCATASNYEVCYENRTGHPTCGADYTINDPIGDTCGEPDDHGIKNVMTGWDIVDIHGFSVGVGKGYDMLPNEDVICADIKLGAKPPYLGSGAVESYMMFFFNPDIPDPNPDDIHFTNSFAVVYTPKICGTDSCQLSQILMDGNCSTNPNNPNPGSCRIFEYYGNEQRLKIGDSSNELKLVVKNNLPNGKSIIGPTNNNAIMFFSTMKIQLSGGTPFSSVDLTPSVRIVNYNQSVSATLSNPAPPILRSNTCQSNGVGTISTCIKQGTTIPAAGNVCVFDILPSPDRSFTNYYNVYYNTVDDRNTATLVETLSGPDNFPENLSSLYTKRFNISNVELDGSPRYFYFSSVNSSAEPELRETPVANWSKAVCFPEDWQAPEPPDDFTCATPQGSDGVCLCEWTADRVSDPSIYGFDIARNNVIQNVSAILTDYFSQSGLTNIAQYSYKIRTMDVGDNKSSWRLAECVPEDRTPPGKIEPSIIAPQGWDNVSVMWNSRNEQDIAGGGGYNVYYCERDNPDACGADSEGMPVGYAKLNVELIPHPDTPGLMSYLVDPSIEFLGNEWCFWVEACDNCKAAGTCPSGDGSNCSRFDEMYRHRICLRGDETPEDNTPLWPENQKATAEPQGQSCRIEWEQVCQGELGEFGNCSFPAQSELTGYKIMRAPAVDGGCGNLPDPSAGVPLSIAPASGPTSYTDSGPHLENGVAYCYRVYAYNMYDRYSRETPAPASSGPVVCVPQDITPPEKPQMNAPLEFDGFSCLPAWSAVADKNPVTYDVHRCEGIWPTCNSAAKFSKINASPMTDLNYIDESVTTETQYVYCVTAMDPIGNASSVYTASDISNCGYCLPSDKCLPPTAVEAFEIAPTYYGARAGW